MRITVFLLMMLSLSGCTALLVGGAAVGGYQLGKDDREPSVVASDSAITTKIKSKYVADSIVSAFDVSVHTYEGNVTLTGTVGSFVARDQATKLAKETGGVISVSNQVLVEDRSDPK